KDDKTFFEEIDVFRDWVGSYNSLGAIEQILEQNTGLRRRFEELGLSLEVHQVIPDEWELKPQFASLDQPAVQVN
ncbi:MAG TPA: hypothetical protein DF383_13185, partial [Deltaproteobacteria bacterium]|nr:hypothetical protein [Deltaproteobacteria bacterium]